MKIYNNNKLFQKKIKFDFILFICMVINYNKRYDIKIIKILSFYNIK